MTSYERVLAAFRRQQPDRVPYDIGSFNREALRRFREATRTDDTDKYFGVDKDIGFASFKATHINLNDRFLAYHEIPKGVTLDNILNSAGNLGNSAVPATNTFFLNEWGTGFIVGSNAAYDHFIPPAVITKATTLKQIEDYPLADFASEYRHRYLEKEVCAIHDKKLACVGCMEMTIFEVAWQIRGLDELLIDFLTNEDAAACLLDRITEVSCFRAKRFAQAGVDIIRTGDDVGMEDRMMIAPSTWRKWLKPRLANVIAAAKEIKPDILISYHSDGCIEPIIPELIEIGVDILNPVQPECMDPADIKKKYGDKLAFWGTIGIQHTIPFGTPRDVNDEVKKRMETVGAGGGFYLSPSHAIAPEVPYENIFALVDAVKKYGRY